MLLAFLLLALGFVVLLTGAEVLVRGSASLARRMGVSVFVIGLTLVAFGTSAPELFVAIQAALGGRDAIAVGNVLGSNIANIGLILGVCAAMYPITCQSAYITREIVVMIGITGALIVGLWDHHLARWEGMLLLAGFVAFIVISYLRGRKQGAGVIPGMEEELRRTHGVAPMGRKPRTAWYLWVIDGVLSVVGLAMLVGGGRLVVDSAVQIADTFGVSQRVIGLTIVALGTSLPELMVGIVAAYRRHADMVLGNVIGSNILNILLILGLTSTIHPLTVAGDQLWLDLTVMLVMSLACLPVVLSGGRINRAEGGALFAGYAAYIALLCFI